MDALSPLAADLLDRAVDDDISMAEAAWRAREVLEATDAAAQSAVAEAVTDLLAAGYATFDLPHRAPSGEWVWSPAATSPSEAAAIIQNGWDAPQNRRHGRLLPGALGWLRITPAGRAAAHDIR